MILDHHGKTMAPAAPAKRKRATPRPAAPTRIGFIPSEPRARKAAPRNTKTLSDAIGIVIDVPELNYES